jgi:hypothetical protein
MTLAKGSFWYKLRMPPCCNCDYFRMNCGRHLLAEIHLANVRPLISAIRSRFATIIESSHCPNLRDFKAGCPNRFLCIKTASSNLTW